MVIIIHFRVKMNLGKVLITSTLRKTKLDFSSCGKRLSNNMVNSCNRKCHKTKITLKMMVLEIASII